MTSFIQEELAEYVTDVIRVRSESQQLEVKEASKGLPTGSLRETMSAFANSTGGGTIILGISERDNFAATGVYDLHRAQEGLAQIASEEFSLPLRVTITPITHGEADVIVVRVPEINPLDKPCFIKAKGVMNGSFLRIGASNRLMTPAEIFDFQAFRQRTFVDDQPVAAADLNDLSRRRIDGYILNIQEGSGRDYSRHSFEEAIHTLRISATVGDGERPTLAGLLCFGDFPQRVLPQLRITFTHYPGTTIAERTPDGERYLDNRHFEGPIDQMIAAAQAAIRNALPIATLVESIQHVSVPLIPAEVIREALINAVAHRDYGPYRIGSSVQIRLFRDRLEIRSPGGLFGGVSLASLETAQSTRNPLLMKFLEDLGLVENRGGGIDEINARLREDGLRPADFSQVDGWFQVTLWRPDHLAGARATELEPESERAMVLGRLAQRGSIRNRDVRELLRVTDQQAVQLLRELVDEGLVVLRGRGRGAHYVPATPPR